jgi:ketosteroid isomerase-like protein
MAELPQQVRRYFDCINAEEWDDFGSIFTDDAEIHPIGSRGRRGREAIVGYFPALLGPWREHHDEPGRCFLKGDTAFVEIDYKGVAGNGAAVEFEAVDRFELAGDQIRRVDQWYDLPSVRRQLSAPVTDLVTTYFNAANADDWDGLRQVFTDDAEVSLMGARTRKGVDDVMALYQRLFTPWSSHDDTPTRTLVDGDTATVEVHFTGTTATGKTLEFDAVDVIDIDGGKIRRLTNWYDLVWVRDQMTGGDA